MIRYRLAFNPNKPQHMQALEILSKQHSRSKTDFIAQCILDFDANLSDKIVCAVKKVLEDMGAIETKLLQPQEVAPMTKIQSRSELPEDFFDMNW